MISHLLSLYRIENLSTLEMKYRLVEVDIPCYSAAADADHKHETVGLLERQMAYSERLPVAIVHRSGAVFIAIPADAKLSKLEYKLTPEVARLKPRDEVFVATFEDPLSDGYSVALSFLRFSLAGTVWRHRELWSSGSACFQKRPANYQENGREVDIYEGFSFRVVRVDDGLYLSVDVKHRYAESAWLLEKHTTNSRSELRMKHVLYHFGHQWYPAQLLDIIDQPIEKATFALPTGEVADVFDYTRDKAGKDSPPWIQSLLPSSPTLVYQYPGSKQRRFGAAALAKLLLPTAEPKVARMHQRSIVAPSERFERTRRFVERYFQDVHMGDALVEISKEAVNEKAQHFAIPALRFGQGRILRLGGSPTEKLGRMRLGTLLDPSAGFAVTSSLSNQYLLVPESLPREISEDFCERIRKTVREFLHGSYVADVVLFNDRNARTLKAQVDAVIGVLDMERVQGGCGLLVLPENAKPDLHNYLKRSLQDRFRFQCVSAKMVRSHYFAQMQRDDKATRWVVAKEREQSYVSYLRYVALGTLLVNRQWPFILEDKTNYEIYIGLDVLKNTAAFSFFHGGGRMCYVQARVSRKKEKLSAKEVYSLIYQCLKDDCSRLDQPPRSVILQRDGRAFETEWHGFRDAMEQLKREGIRQGSDIRNHRGGKKHSRKYSNGREGF